QSQTLCHLSLLFFLQCYGALRDLHSFPTRRSSDLCCRCTVGCRRRGSRGIHCGRSHATDDRGDRPDAVRGGRGPPDPLRGDRDRSEEHTSELQSRENLVCRLLLEKKKKYNYENV